MTKSAIAHGMNRFGRCYAHEDADRKNFGREQIQRRNITNLEAAKFLMRISTNEYSVEKHLNKTPAQINHGLADELQ